MKHENWRFERNKTKKATTAGKKRKKRRLRKTGTIIDILCCRKITWFPFESLKDAVLPATQNKTRVLSSWETQKSFQFKTNFKEGRRRKTCNRSIDVLSSLSFFLVFSFSLSLLFCTLVYFLLTVHQGNSILCLQKKDAEELLSPSSRFLHLHFWSSTLPSLQKSTEKEGILLLRKKTVNESFNTVSVSPSLCHLEYYEGETAGKGRKSLLTREVSNEWKNQGEKRSYGIITSNPGDF